MSGEAGMSPAGFLPAAGLRVCFLYMILASAMW